MQKQCTLVKYIHTSERNYYNWKKNIAVIVQNKESKQTINKVTNAIQIQN